MQIPELNLLWEYPKYWAEKYPDLPIMRFKKKIITNKEFNDATEKLAKAFISMGLNKGDTIITMLPTIPEYIFTFNSVDPDQNNVYYYILWDDGHTEVWDGPHASGADADITHTYTKEGTYTINAKAKDKYDAESNTNVFNITITKKSKPVTNPDIFRFIDTYQILLNGLVKLFGLI